MVRPCRVRKRGVPLRVDDRRVFAASNAIAVDASSVRVDDPVVWTTERCVPLGVHLPAQPVRCNGWLDGGYYCLAQWLRQINRCEETRRVQVVLSGLVDYSDLLVLRGLAVGKNLI